MPAQRKSLAGAAPDPTTRPGEKAERGAPADYSARLEQARGYFRRGRNDDAKMICAGLLNQGWERREVYLLLADLYRSEGERHLAEDMLRRAAAATALPAWRTEERPAARTQQIWVAPPVRVLWLVAIGGLGVAAAGAVAMWWASPAMSLLGANGLHVLPAPLVGFVAGLTLAASGLIRTFDQELAQVAPGVSFPLWLFMLVGGVFSAFLGAFIYLWSLHVQGEYTRTTWVFLGTLGGLAALMGCAVGGGLFFWSLGLSLLFEGMVLGWAVGSAASPREWWQG
jgi:hypothetical protein